MIREIHKSFVDYIMIRQIHTSFVDYNDQTDT